MIIASIDIQNGKAVQLRQGRDFVLERDNPAELAKEFNRYGEVAVIDLDAAMGAKTENGSSKSGIETIKPLLRAAQCRLGGGIRTAAQARELVSFGAEKIIVGSMAFRDPAKKGTGITGNEFSVNEKFLDELAEKIGRERIIIAIDSKTAVSGNVQSGYEIFVDGWKTPTGLDLIQTAQATEKWASGFLFTCIDREGTMTGIDLKPVRLLRDSVKCRITAAGGISTLDEVEELAAMDCDVQLGMALYTGKISLADAFVRSLNWVKGTGSRALLPQIAQSPDGQILMCGFADRESVAESFRRGKLCFHSRSRDKLWMKGETSGNFLKLVKMRADCDRDTILATVEPAGHVCHTGGWSCFETSRQYTLDYLQEIITERFRNPVPGSYTATLDDKLVREKLSEEAAELCEAKTHDELIWEAADVFYFTTALLTRAKVSVREVLDELDRRHKK